MVAVEKEVNPRFEDFLYDWNQKFQLLVGGYGSSKSYHVVVKIIMKLIEEKRTALVVREVYDTHRDSTFSLFSELIEDLGLSHVVRTSTSPMQVKFPNGSKIIFRGMDKPEKLKSINNISLIWLEECSEIKYTGFKELIGRLRHPSLDLFMILSTNPVSKDNWTFKHFFMNPTEDYFVLDDQDLYEKKTIVVGNTYYHHSTADDNLFLPESYIEQLDELASYDPDLHRIARKGQFGVNGKLVLPQLEVLPHEQVTEELRRIKHPVRKLGFDIGFEKSFNALSDMVIDHDKKILYVIDEYYTRGLTDPEIADNLEKKGIQKRVMKMDIDPFFTAYLRQRGFRVLPAKKFPGSRLAYTKKVKRFKRIVISDNCVNHIKELQELTYKVNPKTGEMIEDEFNIDPHTFSAIWYGLDDYEVASVKGHNAKQR